MKTVAALIVAFLFMACSRTYPAITEYRIAPSGVTSTEIIQSSCKNETLKISQVFVKSSLMSKEMKYVVGEYQEYAYNQSEWAEYPNKAITDVIVEYLSRANIFSNVSSYKSFSSSTYTLETNIAEFTQYYSKDEKNSFVRLDITFSLVDNATGKIVDSKHIFKEKKTKATDAQSGVVALNELLFESLREMQMWLAKSCQ